VAEGLHDWWRQAMPLLNYTLAYALQLRKSTENLSQGSRAATGLLVALTWLSFEGRPRLVCCTSVHLGYPGDFSRHKCPPSCRTKGFTASANFESKLSVRCSHVIGEEWNPQALVNLPVTNVSRCAGHNAKTLLRLAASGYGCEQQPSRSNMHNPP
jgi:hypothetical protein